MITEARIALQTEIEITRERFQRLLVLIPEECLKQPSKDPGWTNGEMLCQMSAAPLIIQSILRRNSTWISRYPAITQIVTGSLVQKSNEVLIRSHARNATRLSIAKEYEETCALVLEMLDATSDDSFGKKLLISESDPLLPKDSTVEQLFHYVKNHFDIHRQQINISN
jgi:hypothetical protein